MLFCQGLTGDTAAAAVDPFDPLSDGTADFIRNGSHETGNIFGADFLVPVSSDDGCLISYKGSRNIRYVNKGIGGSCIVNLVDRWEDDDTALCTFQRRKARLKRLVGYEDLLGIG